MIIKFNIPAPLLSRGDRGGTSSIGARVSAPYPGLGLEVEDLSFELLDFLLEVLDALVLDGELLGPGPHVGLPLVYSLNVAHLEQICIHINHQP